MSCCGPVLCCRPGYSNDSHLLSADTDLERLESLKNARNGGSMPTHFAQCLQKHEAKGRLSIHYNTQLSLDESCKWDPDQHIWTHLNISTSESDKFQKTGAWSKLPMHHIILCTGVVDPTMPFSEIPFLKFLQAQYPIPAVGILPQLTEDLAWSDTVPCFLTGSLAALRLGPGAANLAGARGGAERIAWAVEEILAELQPKSDISLSSDADIVVDHLDPAKVESYDPDVQRYSRAADRDRDEFTGSFSNQFATLSRMIARES